MFPRMDVSFRASSSEAEHLLVLFTFTWLLPQTYSFSSGNSGNATSVILIIPAG